MVMVMVMGEAARTFSFMALSAVLIIFLPSPWWVGSLIAFVLLVISWLIWPMRPRTKEALNEKRDRT